MSTRDFPQQIGDLPKLSRPANSALLAQGVSSLAEVAAFGRERLLLLHGVGPQAVQILTETLAERGLEWSDSHPNS